MLNNLIIMQNKNAYDTAKICADLADLLPEKHQFFERRQAIIRETDKMWNDLSDATIQSSSGSSNDVDSTLVSLLHRSNDNFAAANALRRDVEESAKHLKEQRESNYRIARLASYCSFCAGWGLTLYGQLSRKDPSPALPSE
jgi:hypothetical protein